MSRATRAAVVALGMVVATLSPPTASLAAAGQASSRRDTTMQFTVAGMSCSGCAKTATDLLRKLEGVLEAEVNFKTKQATLRTNGAVTKDQIRAALGSLGFEPRFRASRPFRLSLQTNESGSTSRRSLAATRSSSETTWPLERSPCSTSSPTGAGRATC